MKKAVKYLLTTVFFVVLIGGFWFPFLGLAVPVVMGLGMVVSPFKGRWVCGNACPRGAFLDTVMVHFAMRLPMPELFRKAWFRWTLVVVLMGLMLSRLALGEHSWEFAGRLFWMMCVATSAVAFGLALRYNHRAWCAVCPMGTIQGALAPKKGA